MLAIEVVFLTGRYVATAYNTRSESEWPPHPARLFSAFASTHFAADTEDSDRQGERTVLEWLERQGPPAIRASEAFVRDVVTVFVPVNDVALTNVDDEAAELDGVRAALAAAETSGDAKGVKKLVTAAKKADAAFKRAVERATAVPAKASNPRYGERVLPEYRIRQPRTLPSVTPADPRVIYIWQDSAPTHQQLDQIDRLARRIVRLGHSSSLVAARVVSESGPPTWYPDANGDTTFRVVEPGQLDSLEQAFELHQETEPRVMPFVPQSYSGDVRHQTASPLTTIFSNEWLVLRRIEGPQLPMIAAAGLARAVRKTLMSFAIEPIPETLSGHAPDGSPSQLPHLAIVPLPFVGHQHGSGAILGVALILPRDASNGDRKAVYTAVAKWEQKWRQEDEDTPRVRLNLGAAGELHLERFEWGSLQTTLRSATWCGPSSSWYSVTPVALDRNPGELRARDQQKLSEALSNAEATIRHACQRIGLPQPRRVEILPAAPWAGAAKARTYPPYPGDAGRTQRVLTHAHLEFDQPVRGPILIGAGRYIGLGLFRPEPR